MVVNCATAPMFMTQIVNVHWAPGYYVRIKGNANSTAGASLAVNFPPPPGSEKTRGSGKVLSSYNNSFVTSPGGGETTVYYVWLPKQTVTRELRGVTRGQTGGFVSPPAGWFLITMNDEDPDDTESKRTGPVTVGYNSLDDAISGNVPDDAWFRFNRGNKFFVLTTEYDLPPQPDTYTFENESDAEEFLANLAAITALGGTEFFGVVGDQPALSVYQGEYVIEARSSSPDEIRSLDQGFLVSLPESKDESTPVLEVLLTGGLDGDDDPTWLVSIDVFSKKSGTKDSDGKFRDHDPNNTIDLIDPADDALWSFAVDTPDGNPFGLDAGSYKFVMKKRAWQDKDPDGKGGVTNNPQPPPDTLPGKIIEMWLQSGPDANQWGPVQTIALTAENSKNAIYPNTDFRNDNQPFAAGPPPLATVLPTP